MTKKIALNKGFVALVDDDDYPLLSRWKWNARFAPGMSTPYAVRTGTLGERRKVVIAMHRVVTDAPQDMWVDHINGNTLDNCRANLRLATPQQNACNRRSQRGSSSRYLGVTWHKQLKKWQVQISKGGTNYYLGCFSDETEAARTYDRKARELFGEFAHINLPHERSPLS